MQTCMFFVDKVFFCLNLKVFANMIKMCPFHHHSAFYRFRLSNGREHINYNGWAQDVLYNNEKNHLLLYAVILIGEELEAESGRIELIY